MSILLVIACVFLFLAAFGVIIPRIHAGWLGLALWCLSALIPFAAVPFRLGFEWVLIVLLALVIIVILVRPRTP